MMFEPIAQGFVDPGLQPLVLRMQGHVLLDPEPVQTERPKVLPAQVREQIALGAPIVELIEALGFDQQFFPAAGTLVSGIGKRLF